MQGVFSPDGFLLNTSQQDHTNPPFNVKFNQVQVGTTLAVETAIGDEELTVVDATGLSIGHYLIIYSTVTDRYFVGYILDITGNTLTFDTPMDSVFPVGAIVGGAITDMSVDGSLNPQVFGLRGTSVQDPLNETFHITRIIFNCLTDSSVDLSKFADITALTKGLVLRKRNGDYFNIFNVKSNADIEGITLDWNAYSSTNPNQGQNGFSARLTFNGQDKMGVAIDLTEGTDLEFIIQDDLTDIIRLEVVAQGHVLEPNSLKE